MRIAKLLFVLCITVSVVIAAVVFAYAFANSQDISHQPNEVSPWDYTSCCVGDRYSKNFACDHMGCYDAIPNWTPPNGSVRL